MTFAELRRRFFPQPKPEAPPANVVDMEAERRRLANKRWLAKYARPMPPKDPPEAA